jgi:hypothetical protein
MSDRQDNPEAKGEPREAGKQLLWEVAWYAVTPVVVLIIALCALAL